MHLHKLVTRNAQPVTFTLRKQSSDGYAGRGARENEGTIVTVRGRLGPVKDAKLIPALSLGGFEGEYRPLRVLRDDLIDCAVLPHEIAIGTRVTTEDPNTGSTETYSVDARVDNSRMGIFLCWVKRVVR